MVQPASAHSFFSTLTSSATSVTRLSDKSPAIGNGTSALTFPSATRQTAPCCSLMAATATCMSASLAAGNDDVVAVVPDAGGDRAALQAKVLQQAIGDICRPICHGARPP